jgi:hypothetical protein
MAGNTSECHPALWGAFLVLPAIYHATELKKMFCLKRTCIRAHLPNKIFNHASDLGNIPSWACCTSVCDDPYDDSRSWACTSVCDNPYNDSRDSDIIIRCDLVRPIFLIPI